MKVFNKKYKFVNDKNRIIIKNNPTENSDAYFAFIHPVYAWILSLFNGKRTTQCVLDIISKRLHISDVDADRIIKSLYHNKKELAISYDGVISMIPSYVLEYASYERDEYAESFFYIEPPLNHNRRRLSYPQTLLICPTLQCFTDCIYCYANKSYVHKEISSDVWCRLILQAKSVGIERIDITGGEFFLKKGWTKIAKTLTTNGYHPDISTKIPLSDKVIDCIVDSGLKSIQFSLDTLRQSVAKETLCVNGNYVNDIKRSIQYADSKKLRIILKPTLSKFTCNIENVNEVLLFANTLKNISKVVISIIGFSCYKPDDNYLKIRPSLQQVYDMRSYISEIREMVDIPIVDDTFIYKKCEMKNSKVFDERPLCSANVDGFVILPDGTATICEELYWNSFFKIGNISEHSIIELWESTKAESLYFLSSNNFPHDSACHKCKDFIHCRYSKGVCWKLVIEAYGQAKVLYPDPRCPYSPNSQTQFTLD